MPTAAAYFVNTLAVCAGLALGLVLIGAAALIILFAFCYFAAGETPAPKQP